VKRGIIIGAGIGGLTTAIALAQKNIAVKVYEQAAEVKEIGTGIWVAPNGLSVYEELGISSEISGAGKILEKISIVDLKYRPLSTIYGSEVQAKHQFKTVAIHRAVLQKILLSHIPPENIFLNKKFKRHHQTNNSILAEFEDGTTEEADFLINADGLKSNGRLQLNRALNLRYSGQTCWRFVTDFDLRSHEEGNMYEIWANVRGLRVGYSKINERQVYVFITNFEKAGGKDNLETLREDILKLCADFPDIIKHLITAVDVSDINRTDLFDFKPISNWIEGRAALIGDAAHATTPNLGQGACQAIEDAFVIAQELSKNADIETCFKNFQQKRIKKATYITNISWQFARITNTSGMTKFFLKNMLRLTPDVIMQKQLDKIYSLEYR